MAEASEKIKELRTKIESWLKEIVGGYEVRENYYVVRLGSARINIFLYDLTEKYTMVAITSITNVDLDLTPELAKFLVTENAQMLFGSFSYDSNNRYVLLTHQLLGNFLDKEEFRTALNYVAYIVDGYDDKIKTQFGGK